jgi:CheY-like chemotaxis protein
MTLSVTKNKNPHSGTYDRIKAIGGLHEPPMAFFTTSEDPKDIQKARDMGAVDYIRKPVKKTELLERAEKILKK